MEHSVQRFLFPYKKKIRPVHYKVSGALKTDSFLTAARFLQGRSYATGGARYLLPDLMLLTHAGCAFKDPRGRFGISGSARPDAFGRGQRVEICLEYKAPVSA